MPLTSKEINLPTTIFKGKKEGNKGNKLKTIRGDGSRINFVGVTKLRQKGGRSPTNKNTKHKQTRENTQQLNISLQIFITTTTLLINLHEYNN